MRAVVCMVLCFLFSDLYGQTSVYHPFPDSSAVWTIQSQACCANNCPGPPFPNPEIIDYNFSYFISGDTSVNGLTYSKIYKSGSAHAHCLFGTGIDNWTFFSNDYSGALRQDTALRTVYFLAAMSLQECLLYDFNLSVGDTLQGTCLLWGSECAVVTAIDSFAVGSNYRKKFLLSTNPPYEIIEGIGSTSGLLEPLCPFEYFGTLICFSRDGQTEFPDMITGCEIVSREPELPTYNNFTIEPNPMRSNVIIRIHPAFDAHKWKIYNMMGMELRSGIVDYKTVTIPRDNLPSGTYFISISGQKGFRYSQIFIAE